MTVTYTAQVASSSWACFLKLLFRWRGSVYKLLWKELIAYLVLYYLLNLMYRFALNAYWRDIFEQIVVYCDSFNSLIPVAFVLGFYVSVICTRWWEQFKTIPWPDRTAVFVTAHLHGHDERPRLMRRTIMRYLVLSFTMTLSAVSIPVKKRFPTLDHMKDAGLMLEGEQKIIENLQTPHSKYFVPLVWATTLVTRARKEGLIKDDSSVRVIIDEINRYRGDLGMLYNFDWVNIPMVYTQVVTLAVYTFFLSCLMGRQFVDKKDFENRRPDMYFPLFTLLQFFFYMGWLKVAETLINPFGDDDDDFDINTTIDRNIQVSYLIVDEMHSELPELIRDAYWDETEFEMPWTQAAVKGRIEPHLGSAVDILVSSKEADFVPLSSAPLSSIPEESPSAVRSQTADGVDMPLSSDHESDNSGPSGKRKKIFFKKPKSFRTKNQPLSINSADVGGGSVSSAASVTVQITPAYPEQGGKDEAFRMSDIDGSDDNAALPSSDSGQKLKEQPNGPASGECFRKGNVDTLTHLNQADTKDSGFDNTSQLMIPGESETSLSKTQKYLDEIPTEFIIQYGLENEVEVENTAL